MHIVFGRYLKYILWFIFAVILGSFLIGFAKFGFNANLYIDYLNGMEARQLFQTNTQTGDVMLETGSDLTDLSGTQDIYDPSLDEDFFGQTGVQTTGTQLSGATESFGFVKDSSNTGEKIENIEKPEAKATVVSTGSASNADKLKSILDLAKKEK